MLLASLQGTIGPSWRSPTHWNSFPQPPLGGTSPNIPDVRVNPAFTEIVNWIAFHDTVYCGVTSSHCYFGWMLRQFWFWFPDNCFLMDLVFFFFGPKQMPAPIPRCHFQLPSKPDLFLNESATHWARAKANQEAIPSKYPWWESLFPSWTCVSLGSHLTWRACEQGDGRTFEPWLLLKRPNPGDSSLFTFLLSFAFEAAPHWWNGGALWLLYILKPHSPEFAPVMETCTLSFKQIKREVSQK